MVYYVRFLKTPRIQTQKSGSCIVSTLICITTDLGDSFLSQTVRLLVTIAQERTGPSILHQEEVIWHAGKRELSISLGPFPLELSRRQIVLGVGPIDAQQQKKGSVLSDHIPSGSNVPLVISGWSASFGGSWPLVAEKLVERRLVFGDTLRLNVWEETGNSIARHIW